MNNQSYLTDTGIVQMANSVGQTSPHEKMSDRYTYVSTMDVIHDMRKLGWLPVDAKQVNSKVEAGFQKHMVSFEHPDIKIVNNDDAINPRLLLINSHNGKSSFELQAGLFRLVCSNGLVIADQMFSKTRIRHMGYTYQELSDSVSQSVETLPETINNINWMQDRIMTKGEMGDFAEKALTIRFGEEHPMLADIDLSELLEVRRKEDNGNDLWKVFNRVQENVIHGNFHHPSVNKKGIVVSRKARSIKQFNEDIRINKEL